ncbi:MAG: hypothetical protein JWM85_879 [Acidimicrobiaceae bacterium]|nr:hypothetical protein [Acidimicrobiaceae bacterium]
MHSVIDTVAAWRAGGLRVAWARVVDTEGPSPRAAGATMAVSEDGRVAGSISGGCIDSTVVERAQELLVAGGCQLIRFGYSDDEAFSVGQTCGGVVTIFISGTLPDAYDSFEAAFRRSTSAVLVTIIDGGDGPVSQGASMLVHGDGRSEGTFGDECLDRAVISEALAVLPTSRSSTRAVNSKIDGHSAAPDAFFHALTVPPKMIVIGAVDFALALANQAQLLGYAVTICDPRATFATRERFPTAGDVVVDWPDRYLASIGTTLGQRDAVCVLSHEARFDVPAIMAALSTEVGYVGALGSRRTTADRRSRLLDAGAEPAALDRLNAPIGLNLGARTPEETALSICAEIVALQNRRMALPLREVDGPIQGSPTPSGTSPGRLRADVAQPTTECSVFMPSRT